MQPLTDSHGRNIDYLRVSVTDRCNLKCVYCETGETSRIETEHLLSAVEIERLVRLAVAMGISKVRLTGGEPLARPGIVDIVKTLAAIPGLEDLSLTTNGFFLERFAGPLKKAGLHRINVSLDTLRPDRFRAVCGAGSIDAVLRGIAAARRADLVPVKINMVVIRGANDDELTDLVAFAANDGLVMRFIEYMPIRTGDDWKEKFFSREEMLHVLSPMLARLTPGEPTSDPARYYPLAGGGAVGLISPVSHGFCDRCNRLRLTPDGALQACLLSGDRIDLRGPLRAGASDAELETLIRDAVRRKGARGNFNEAPTMRRIGG